MNITYYNLELKALQFEGISNVDKEMEYRSISTKDQLFDIWSYSNTFHIMNNGIAILNKKDVYVVKYLEGRITKSFKLDFNINDLPEWRIQGISVALDNEFLIIRLEGTGSGDHPLYLTVVWNIDKNIEDSNFSSETEPTYFYGSNSRRGYIYANDYYVNLDLGLKNYYFEHAEPYLSFSNNSYGYKINKSEDMIVQYE
jgi:hypothetical protein